MSLNLHDMVFYHNKDIYEIVDYNIFTNMQDNLIDKTYTIQHIKSKRIISNVDKSELTKHPTLELLYGKSNPVPSQKV